MRGMKGCRELGQSPPELLRAVVPAAAAQLKQGAREEGRWGPGVWPRGVLLLAFLARVSNLHLYQSMWACDWVKKRVLSTGLAFIQMDSERPR